MSSSLFFPLLDAKVTSITPGDPLAKIFRGRPVKEDPDSQVLKQIAGWIADCNATHSCCPSKATLPRRLIDVGSSKFESLVRLVDLNEGIEGHYTALSYSRERGIRGDLARSTISPGRSSSIDVATLPKVYHDAMSVTRNLGIRYLWIDALCIPSDDLGEYVRESSKFAAVYTSAYLTIAATGARDDSEGLFFQRTSRSLVRLAHEGPQNTTGTLLMHLLPLNKEVHRAPYVEMKSEPLLNGVWAFQERVLAPRTIHFASDQIYFECMTHFVSEDGLLLNHRTHPTAKKLPPRGDRSRALSRWFQTLWDYGDCDPVKASDKLPAMGNIARAFQGILEDEYVAGLWKKSLIEGLCWQSLKCKPVNEYRAPSWSWASVDGTTGAGFHALRWEPLAIVQDMHVELEGSHPFGRIRAAWIRLEAPLAPLTLSEPKGPTGHIFLRTESSSDDGFYAGLDTINDVCDESREMLRDMNLFALLLAETRGLDGFPGGCGSGSCYHGIIVTPGDGPEESMKRIGFFVADPENFGPANIQSWKQVITLV